MLIHQIETEIDKTPPLQFTEACCYRRIVEEKSVSQKKTHLSGNSGQVCLLVQAARYTFVKRINAVWGIN